MFRKDVGASAFPVMTKILWNVSTMFKIFYKCEKKSEMRIYILTCRINIFHAFNCKTTNMP